MDLTPAIVPSIGFISRFSRLNFCQQASDDNSIGFTENNITKYLFHFLLTWKGPTRGVLDPDFPWQNRPYPE